jgi:hypothetical protein
MACLYETNAMLKHNLRVAKAEHKRANRLTYEQFGMTVDDLIEQDEQRQKTNPSQPNY